MDCQIVERQITDKGGSDEIKNHCEREYAGKVMVHRAGCKIDSHDPKELLQEHDIM